MHEASLKLTFKFEEPDESVEILVLYGTDRDINRLRARIRYWENLEAEVERLRREHEMYKLGVASDILDEIERIQAKVFGNI